MSSSERTRGDPGAPAEAATLPTAAPAAAGGGDSTWLDRMQRARARQAAITRNLYTWSNYKNWADQVRDSWAATEPGATPGAAKPKK